MSDISTVWNADTIHGDWRAVDGILQQGNDLLTAMWISAFTDRQALPDDEIPDGTTDRRGWIGDAGEAYPIGSRLWLLDREKQTNDVLSRAQDYLCECWQWLIDDQVVAGLEILVEWVRRGFLGVVVVAHKPDGTTETLNFEWAWSGL